MKNLAPSIYRQRIVIEGLYTKKPTEQSLAALIEGLSKALCMTIVYGPIVKNVAGPLNPKHAGLEALAIWAESGLSVYVWDNPKFFTSDIYTCKPFDPQVAVDYIRDFFGSEEMVFKEV